MILGGRGAVTLPPRRYPNHIGSAERLRVPTMNPVPMGGLMGLVQQRAQQYRNNGPGTSMQLTQPRGISPNKRSVLPRTSSTRVPPLMPMVTLSHVLQRLTDLQGNPGVNLMRRA